jgi:hypothetical protein
LAFTRREVHDVGTPRDARVVDEHVHLPERGDHAVDHLVDGGHLADVGGQGEAPTAERGDGVRRRLGGAALDVDGRHVRARPGHRERDGLADAVAGAGDDRDTVRQRHPRGDLQPIGCREDTPGGAGAAGPGGGYTRSA